MKFSGQARDEAFRSALLEWFRRSARRLPLAEVVVIRTPLWCRANASQTQVATGDPVLTNAFSSVSHISHWARPVLEPVLELWSGLGYYRRARHLHQAAKELVRRLWAFPQDYEQIRSLPELGITTAGQFEYRLR